MSVNKKQCTKCKNSYEICPKKSAEIHPEKLLHLQQGPHKDCIPCEVKISLVDYYVWVRGGQPKDVKCIANEMIQQLMEAKRAEHEQKLQTTIANESKNDRLKRLLITGGFWLGLLAAIFYMLINLAISNIHWARFTAVLLVLPILFTLPGAFILRSADRLKEKSFMELVKLSLKLNFKSIMSLQKKKNLKNNSGLSTTLP
jgi:cation transport ATPase